MRTMRRCRAWPCTAEADRGCAPAAGPATAVSSLCRGGVTSGTRMRTGDLQVLRALSNGLEPGRRASRPTNRHPTHVDALPAQSRRRVHRRRPLPRGSSPRGLAAAALGARAQVDDAEPGAGARGTTGRLPSAEPAQGLRSVGRRIGMRTQPCAGTSAGRRRRAAGRAPLRPEAGRGARAWLTSASRRLGALRRQRRRHLALAAAGGSAPAPRTATHRLGREVRPTAAGSPAAVPHPAAAAMRTLPHADRRPCVLRLPAPPA